MYPLKAILIGCETEDLSPLRHDLANQGVAIDVEFSDVADTIAKLASAPEAKRLFILIVRTPADLHQLERLNDTFVGRPILAMLQTPTDPALILRAMRSGAAQVIPVPYESEDFRLTLERIARQFGYSSSASKVIAVTGVSEGCGATAIAINLASEIAQLHQRSCILVELSLRLGRLAGYLDLEPYYTTHSLLSDVERMDIDTVRQALSKMADNFHVLAGPYKGIAALQPDPQHVVRLVDLVRRLADVVVLDMPCTFDDVYFESIAHAD